MDRKQKVYLTVFSFVAFALAITWLAQPIYVNWYFDMQPVETIEGSFEELNSVNTGANVSHPLYPGQTIVLQGVVSDQRFWFNGIPIFNLTDATGTTKVYTNTSEVTPAQITINCIPQNGQNVKIMGFWASQHHIRPQFYLVRVIKGC